MTIKEDLDEKLQNPEFKEAYEDLSAFSSLTNAILSARLEAGITQAELAKRTGIAQGELSKIETGMVNPSLKRINRIAKGLGCKVQVSFIPRA